MSDLVKRLRAPSMTDTTATHIDRMRMAADVLESQAAEIEALRKDGQSLRAALEWYAKGEHFAKAEPDAWDTTSGEPPNWWSDEVGTAMVEDGTLARMVLDGKITGHQLNEEAFP